jgi:HKD family nuclease
MHTTLPTCRFDSWTATALNTSLAKELLRDKEADSLQMFFHAITSSGWNEIRKPVLKWMNAKTRRRVTVFVGTDHAITDPHALEMMQEATIEVRIMNNYRGVFHPKVVWLNGKSKNLVWVGSNNLTKDGLLNNIEFAVLVDSKKIPPEMSKWVSTVASASTLLDVDLLRSYKEERKKFEKSRASTKATTFTWSKKNEPPNLQEPTIGKGDLVLEIMPEETRGGNQVQIPKKAVKQFFGLEIVGQQKI